MKCGLLGRKLGHSYSPAIHAMLGDYSYRLYEKEPAELEYFLRNGDWDGLNVTIPYKQAVIPYLDALTPIAEKLGAVNTILRRDGKLLGSNTDYPGFLSMVEQSKLCLAGKNCLILGSGGASKVVQAAVQELNAHGIVISRNGVNNYENISQHRDASIIINTTPVGMYPETRVSPINLDMFPALEGVLDLVYNPARTQLLLDAEKRGLVAMNGLWMLVSQAKHAAELFTNASITSQQVCHIYNTLQAQMKNIILIGMPGCGKSTIGPMLAAQTGKIFVDMDSEIENMAQKTIPQIFAEDGEETFRSLETKVLHTFGKKSSLVIATGGGCVTQERNYSLLHQNGTIFWLQRDVAKLPIDGRPLSQQIDLQKMYDARRHMYYRFADHIIDNNSDPETTVSLIINYLKDRTENRSL